MSRLPLDIWREIFIFSPAESLIRFRTVCKRWRAVIDDPRFVQAHTNQQQQLPSTTILIRNSTGHPLSSLDLETLDFANVLQSSSAAPLLTPRGGLSGLPKLPVASCNGLMLIPPPSRTESNWEIWNILTRERLQLPRPDFVYRWNPNGLGYDCATDDYKAVVIVLQESDLHAHQTHVYSLRSDSWKEISNFLCTDDDWHLNCPVGVFLHGALHWITWNGITVLDLKTESYHQLEPQLPLHERDSEDVWNRVVGIDVLDGCLVVSDFGTDDEYDFKHFDLWAMKDYSSWMKVFALECETILAPSVGIRPVAYMKNMKQVFLQDDVRLYLFELESDSLKSVVIPGVSGKVSTQVFQGSLFRLHDNRGRVTSGVSDTKERRINKRDFDTMVGFCVDSKNWYYSSAEDED